MGRRAYNTPPTLYHSSFYLSPFTIIFWVAVSLMGLAACGQRSDTIVSIALNPSKSNIIYVATDEAVYKSSDIR